MGPPSLAPGASTRENCSTSFPVRSTLSVEEAQTMVKATLTQRRYGCDNTMERRTRVPIDLTNLTTPEIEGFRFPGGHLP
jgi:hypothetical protein